MNKLLNKLLIDTVEKNESLGIQTFSPEYIKLLSNQNIIEELISIENLINDAMKGKEYSIQFINYGSTQLVFVITLNNKKYTLLINQPATEYGGGKNEFSNLISLNKINPDLVIKPIYYHEKDNKELYITPYYYQARCIGIDTNNWGMWIPEPNYHFENFNKEKRSIITSTMIASLISLYNEKTNQGISKYRLDGGDFMLLKDHETNEFNYENIYNNLKLIAARELIKISLNDYINKMRIELNNNISKEEIETGIEMGLKLRKKTNYHR